MVVSTDFRPVKHGMFEANLGLLDVMTLAIDVVKARIQRRPDLEHDRVLSCWQINEGALSSNASSYLVRRRRAVEE